MPYPRVGETWVRTRVCGFQPCTLRSSAKAPAEGLVEQMNSPLSDETSNTRPLSPEHMPLSLLQTKLNPGAHQDVVCHRISLFEDHYSQVFSVPEFSIVYLVFC